MRLRFSRLVKIVYAIVSSVVFGAAVPAFLVMGNSRASIGWGTAALSALMHGIVSHRLHKNRSVHRSASPFLLLWGSAGVFGMGGYGGYCFYLGASEESKLDVSSPYLAGISACIAIKWIIMLLILRSRHLVNGDDAGKNYNSMRSSLLTE